MRNVCFVGPKGEVTVRPMPDRLPPEWRIVRIVDRNRTAFMGSEDLPPVQVSTVDVIYQRMEFAMGRGPAYSVYAHKDARDDVLGSIALHFLASLGR